MAASMVTCEFDLSVECAKCGCRTSMFKVALPVEIDESATSARIEGKGHVEVRCTNDECQRSVKFGEVKVAAA